uniref:HSF-type DNA-binding domain-containing protein n=1 Tax=Cyanoderma ruficeps TaxID=181631 RepID=A0A8C3QN55_9PASS
FQLKREFKIRRTSDTKHRGLQDHLCWVCTLPCHAMPGQPREPPRPRCARGHGSSPPSPARAGAALGGRGAEHSAPLRPRAAGSCGRWAAAVGLRALWRQLVIGAMAELLLPAGLNTSTFPAKLWRLVNSPHIRSLRWDSQGRGLLIDRSFFERELLSKPDAHGGGATRFGSFVRQLNLYGFQKVPAWAGAAVPGDAGGWLHFRNPNFCRDRPDLLFRIKRLTRANRQRLAAGLEVRSRPPGPSSRQLHTDRSGPAFPAGQPPRAGEAGWELRARRMAWALAVGRSGPWPCRGRSAQLPRPAQGLSLVTVPVPPGPGSRAGQPAAAGQSCRSSAHHTLARSACSWPSPGPWLALLLARPWDVWGAVSE